MIPIRTALLAAALLGALSASAAHAAVITFAQYIEQSTSAGGNLQFTAGTGSANLHAYHQAAGDPVFFSFLGIAGLPADLLTPQNALLRFNVGTGAATTAAAQSTVVSGLGTLLSQSFNQPFTMSFSRTSDYVFHGVDYGRNLLTVSVAAASATPGIVTIAGSRVGGISFDNTNYLVSFTSDFLTFKPGATEDGSLAFSAATPAFAKGTKFLRSFRADSTGTFDSDPVPVGTIIPIPEPLSAALLGSGLLAVALARRRRVHHTS
jgi:hypothetical protein